MAKSKRKPNKTERREKRLQRAAIWLPTYEGTRLFRDYRKKFKLDFTRALNDLEALGVLSSKKLADLRQEEEIRQLKKQEEKKARLQQEFHERWSDSDDNFYFIAGYTSCGAPFGITWEEMGLKPHET